MNLKNFLHNSSVYFMMNIFGRELSYNVQRVNLPGISFSNIELSKTAQRFYKQGDTPSYNTLSVDIIIDENLKIWKELVQTIQMMTIEGNGDMNLTEFTSYLNIYDEKDQGVLKLSFIDCVIQSISDVEFETSGDDTELVVSLTIDYAFYTFNKEIDNKKDLEQKALLKNTIVSKYYDIFKAE